jgi:hypothetical protein
MDAFGRQHATGAGCNITCRPAGQRTNGVARDEASHGVPADGDARERGVRSHVLAHLFCQALAALVNAVKSLRGSNSSVCHMASLPWTA